MSSDKRSFGCVEYALIVAICAMIGMILYATLEHTPHETPHKIAPSKIGHKMGSVKGATMGSTLGAAITKSAITTVKPTHQSIHYLPIHLHKAIRTIRIIPEGQEAD
jgi:hypothetical protein